MDHTSFSSFPSFASLPAGPSHQTESKGTERLVREEKKKKKKKRERKEHEILLHEPSNGAITSDEHRKTQVPQEFENAQTSLQYYSDRKGDPLNVRYDGLDARYVPKYSLVAYGRKVLGMGSAWNAYKSAKGITIDIGHRYKSITLTDSSTRRLLVIPPTHIMLNNSEDVYKYEEIDGYLRLPSRGSHLANDAYRDILPQHTDDTESESSQSENQTDSEGDKDLRPLTAHQIALKSLEQQLDSDPNNEDVWLRLLSQTLTSVPIQSKNASQVRAEISVSILTRALAVLPKSRILRLKFVESGEKIWHESKLRTEWTTAFALGGTELRLEWLEWRIRKANAGLESVVNDARRVLNTYGDSEEDEIAKVRVLWRMALLFKNAGYTERSTALLQAQAEIAFNLPASLVTAPFSEQLDALEEFWESETARFGEIEGQGWKVWAESGKKDHEHVIQPSDSDNTVKGADPYLAWYNQETNIDAHRSLPTRSTDDDGSDPFSTILFSDIRQLLIPLQSLHAKQTFRLIWLSLQGLPVPGLANYGRDDRWALPHLAKPPILLSVIPPQAKSVMFSNTSENGTAIGLERRYNGSAFGPVKNWTLRVVEPLQPLGLEMRSLWSSDEVQIVDKILIRSLFKQMRLAAVEDVEWDELNIVFEAAINVKSALKLSRELLSKASNSLAHWILHARLERLRGRLDEARKIYRTVTSSASLPSKICYVYRLWYDWAEMEWLTGNTEDCRHIIMRSTGETSSGRITYLRVKTFLKENMHSLSDWKEREACLKLMALLELATTASITNVLEIFDSQIRVSGSLTNSTNPDIESLTVSSLMMLYHHAHTLRNAMQPAILRDRVHQAFQKYPSNSVVFGLLLEAEKGQGVWGRVRALHDNGDGVKDVCRRVEEVWLAGWELGRWRAEEERTRAGLAAAMEDPRTRGSPIIRRIYVEFLIRAGHLLQAKTMLYVAIGDHPLHKDFYMMAFGPLRSVFDRHELDSFADTMAERGLRMRQNLEDFTNGYHEPRKVTVGSEDEVSDDEIELNARELRRLKPY